MASAYIRWLGASIRFVGIKGSLGGAAVVPAISSILRKGRGEFRCSLGLPFLFALLPPIPPPPPPRPTVPGVEGYADRRRGVPFMTIACSPGYRHFRYR